MTITEITPVSVESRNSDLVSPTTPTEHLSVVELDHSRSPQQPIGGIDLESLARLTEGKPLTAEQSQILFESEQIRLLLGGTLVS